MASLSDAAQNVFCGGASISRVSCADSQGRLQQYLSLGRIEERPIVQIALKLQGMENNLFDNNLT